MRRQIFRGEEKKIKINDWMFRDLNVKKMNEQKAVKRSGILLHFLFFLYIYIYNEDDLEFSLNEMLYIFCIIRQRVIKITQ